VTQSDKFKGRPCTLLLKENQNKEYCSPLSGINVHACNDGLFKRSQKVRQDSMLALYA
jgi:hypothetical protein